MCNNINYNNVLFKMQHLLAADNFLALHSYNTACYAVSFTNLLLETGAVTEKELSPGYSEDLMFMSAFLHDVGKLYVPDVVLYKDGHLTDCEWDRVKLHVTEGQKHLESLFANGSCSRVKGMLFGAVVQHHERWDGSGYVCGLRGKDISLVARIISVVDCYDAMTSLRPYGARRTHDEALEELNRVSGSQLDPFLVDVFLDGVKTEKIILKAQS